MHIGLTVINAALMICSKLPWVGPLFKVLKKLGSFLSKSVAKCNKGLKKLVKKTKPLQKAMDKTQAVMDTADTYLAPPAVTRARRSTADAVAALPSRVIARAAWRLTSASVSARLGSLPRRSSTGSIRPSPSVSGSAT